MSGGWTGNCGRSSTAKNEKLDVGERPIRGRDTQLSTGTVTSSLDSFQTPPSAAHWPTTLGSNAKKRSWASVVSRDKQDHFRETGLRKGGRVQKSTGGGDRKRTPVTASEREEADR